MDQLAARFPGKFRKLQVLRPRAVQAVIDRDDLVEVCLYLKEEMEFAYLSCVTAVDWRDRWESVYHLVRYGSHAVVQLNAIIPYDDPRIDSVTKLWSGADVHEREAWDLMGIEYVGHPNLTRILLPKDFKFHPLRKDFPQEVDRQYISRRKIGGG